MAGLTRPWSRTDRYRKRTTGRCGWLERAFEERLRRKTLFPRLKDALQSQPPFLRDTELLFQFRTYYLLRDNADGSENEAWAAGGWLRYRSGWLLDCSRSARPLYTSRPLYAPSDKDGTLLLAPGQEPYAVLGEAYAASATATTA